MKRRNSNSPWSLNFNTAVLILIPAAVGINYLGKVFVGILKLPLWLDSIGTCLVAVLGGPIIGAICGATNNIIYGLTMDPISMVYALSQAGIGIVVGLLSYYGMFKGIKGQLFCGICAGLIAVIISTPLNIIFWGGTTGNLWGDLVYAWALSKDMPVLVASALDEIIVDLPDKMVVIATVMGIYNGLPKSLLSLYQSNSKIECLD